MHLNIKFNLAALARVAGMVVLAGLPASVRAQLEPSGSPRSTAKSADVVESALPLQGEGYRNGSLWISAERERLAGAAALDAAARTPVVLRTGVREFHARIDAQAIVQLTEDARPDAIWQSAGLRVVRVLSSAARIYLVTGAAREDGLQIAQRLAQFSGVLEAIPDLHLMRQRHSISLPPNDPRYGGQWYLRKTNIADAWQYTTGTRDTTIVVVDDGCDMKHPELTANLLGGLDVVDSDDDASFEPGLRGNSHGTQCAGLIAAQADNGIGIAGSCPECTLRCVRLLNNRNKPVPLSADVQAFDYALTTGASVVSNSWGFSEAMPAPAPLRNLLVQLYHEGRDGRGTLVLFAAGNENRLLEDDELAAVEGVIAVGAINNFDEATSFSNYGASLFLTAPTGTITTDISGSDGDDPGDYTELFGGTSSACPVAAGVAALLMSAKPELSASEVHDLLGSTTREAPYAEPNADGHDDIYGFGIINPARAIRSALGIPEPEIVDAGAPDSGKAAGAAGGDAEHHTSGGSGCNAVAGASQELRGGAWFVAALLAWVVRRRPSSRRR
jgi:subtilisin family serine protease